MPFIKNFIAPNGATLTFHKISLIEIRDESLNYTVQSWVSESDYLAKKNALWNSYFSASTPQNFIENIELLAIAEPEFAGASIIPNTINTIDAVKSRKWAELKQTRDQKLELPLNTPYGTFDADQRSQKNITDAIQLLQTLEAQQPGQTIEFTLNDNTTVTLTTQQMVSVGLALGQRTQQVYATSRQLRQQLDMAQTKQEVEAVTWPQ